VQVTVGRIGRPHGVRGDVVVGVRTDEPELRFAPGSRLDTDPVGAGPLTVSSIRWHSGELLVRFDGISDRTTASGLGGTWLLVDAATIGATGDPDEFHDTDLIGLAVRTVDGQAVGAVEDVLHSGQDVLVVRPAGGGPDVLVPFVRAIVTEVDVAGGVLVIDPPVGLLNLEDAV
jgi:16S rRNA processing protein RimM